VAPITVRTASPDMIATTAWNGSVGSTSTTDSGIANIGRVSL
jgi:hypothetical protein